MTNMTSEEMDTFCRIFNRAGSGRHRYSISDHLKMNRSHVLISEFNTPLDEEILSNLIDQGYVAYSKGRLAYGKERYIFLTKKGLLTFLESNNALDEVSSYYAYAPGCLQMVRLSNPAQYAPYKSFQ